MKHLVTLKLKSQDVDLVGYQSEEHDDYVTIEYPVQVKLDTSQGFYAIDWLYLADAKVISIDKSDIFYYTEPSDRAHTIYDEFWESVYHSKQDSIDEIDELQTLFESKIATKH